MEKNKKILLSILIGVVVLGGGLYFLNNIKNQPENIQQEKTEGCDVSVNENIHHLISPQEFKEKLDSGNFVLVDIRTPAEFNEEKIAGAKNIDFYKKDFKDKVSLLDKNKQYLYYCRTGHRSGLAGKYAEELGFKTVYELEGGIVKWKELGYPTEK